MAITSDEESNAVQLLLDYYFDGADLPHSSAQRAWEILAGAARDQRGTGWRASQACTDANNDCRFHRGALFGHEQALTGAADALKVFARDPEQIGGLLELDARNQEAEQRHQVRDQVSPIGSGLTEHEREVLNSNGAPADLPGDCPSCGLRYRRWDPNAEEVVCAHCGYRY